MLQPVQREIQRVETWRGNGECWNAFVFSQLTSPPIPPSIRVFSNESTLRMRWPKYWSFSCSIFLSKEQPGLISFIFFLILLLLLFYFTIFVLVLPYINMHPLEWTGWISLQSKGLSRVFSNTTVQKHQFFGTQLSLRANGHIHTWLLEKP